MHTKLIFPLLLPLIIITGSCRNSTPGSDLLSENSADSVVCCTGYLVVESEGPFVISSPFAGKIISIGPRTGQNVKAGEHLALIENTDFIVIQQEFLEAANMLEYYSEEYARQGDLTVENATSMKKMQAAKKDFQSAELKYNSLHRQLSVMGLRPDSLKPDRLTAVLPVRTSRQGIVTGINIHPGSYIEKGDPLFAIATGQSVMLKLDVPEEAYLRVHEGQHVDCRPVMDSLNVLKAIVRSVSPEINPISKTVTVYAEPEQPALPVIPGMSVRAVIRTR